MAMMGWAGRHVGCVCGERGREVVEAAERAGQCGDGVDESQGDGCQVEVGAEGGGVGVASACWGGVSCCLDLWEGN
jgi:hypothetical protein